MREYDGEDEREGREPCFESWMAVRRKERRGLKGPSTVADIVSKGWYAWSGWTVPCGLLCVVDLGDRATNEWSHCRISRMILEITEGIQGRDCLLYESCTEGNICMSMSEPKIRPLVVVWSVIYLADDKRL